MTLSTPPTTATVPSFGFTGPLRVERVARNQWLTCAPLPYIAKDAALYCVPEGFVTDFASVPRIFQNLIDDDDYCPAAVLHDYFYATHFVDKRRADYLFREALESLGCGWLSRWLQWRAVHRFGGFAWRKRLATEAARETLSEIKKNQL